VNFLYKPLRFEDSSGTRGYSHRVHLMRESANISVHFDTTARTCWRVHGISCFLEHALETKPQEASRRGRARPFLVLLIHFLFLSLNVLSCGLPSGIVLQSGVRSFSWDCFMPWKWDGVTGNYAF
jgi:hypothetical protein